MANPIDSTGSSTDKQEKPVAPIPDQAQRARSFTVARQVFAAASATSSSEPQLRLRSGTVPIHTDLDKLRAALPPPLATVTAASDDKKELHKRKQSIPPPLVAPLPPPGKEKALDDDKSDDSVSDDSSSLPHVPRLHFSDMAACSSSSSSSTRTTPGSGSSDPFTPRRMKTMTPRQRTASMRGVVSARRKNSARSPRVIIARVIEANESPRPASKNDHKLIKELISALKASDLPEPLSESLIQRSVGSELKGSVSTMLGNPVSPREITVHDEMKIRISDSEWGEAVNKSLLESVRQRLACVCDALEKSTKGSRTANATGDTWKTYCQKILGAALELTKVPTGSPPARIIDLFISLLTIPKIDQDVHNVLVTAVCGPDEKAAERTLSFLRRLAIEGGSSPRCELVGDLVRSIAKQKGILRFALPLTASIQRANLGVPGQIKDPHLFDLSTVAWSPKATSVAEVGNAKLRLELQTLLFLDKPQVLPNSMVHAGESFPKEAEYQGYQSLDSKVMERRLAFFIALLQWMKHDSDDHKIARWLNGENLDMSVSDLKVVHQIRLEVYRTFIYKQFMREITRVGATESDNPIRGFLQSIALGNGGRLIFPTSDKMDRAASWVNGGADIVHGSPLFDSMRPTVQGLMEIARLCKLRQEVWRQMFFGNKPNCDADEFTLDGEAIFPAEYIEKMSGDRAQQQRNRKEFFGKIFKALLKKGWGIDFIKSKKDLKHLASWMAGETDYLKPELRQVERLLAWLTQQGNSAFFRSVLSFWLPGFFSSHGDLPDDGSCIWFAKIGGSVVRGGEPYTLKNTHDISMETAVGIPGFVQHFSWQVGERESQAYSMKGEPWFIISMEMIHTMNPRTFEEGETYLRILEIETFGKEGKDLLPDFTDELYPVIIADGSFELKGPYANEGEIIHSASL